MDFGFITANIDFLSITADVKLLPTRKIKSRAGFIFQLGLSAA
jgi:hypothetical protein